MPRSFCILVFLSVTLNCFCNCYWIGLRDKQGTTGHLSYPEQFLSERALQRRHNQHIAIDSIDLPVSRLYVDSIRKAGAEILYTSKWHNGVTVRITSTGVVDLLRTYDFIGEIQLTEDTLYEQNPLPSPYLKRHIVSTDSVTYGKADTQVKMIRLNKLHDAGYHGSGMLIAIADDGFYRAHTIEALHEACEQTVYTHDFVNKGGDVYQQGTHGTQVLSTIAARHANMHGTAIEADFLLMRTEDDDYENYREMDNLCAAFELADSIGADIMNISLGYLNAFDSPDMTLNYSQLDGRRLRCSRSATIAARKGMIVCVAAGNEGNKDWHYICAPADADSIMCVGGVTAAGLRNGFSSFGPSADGRVKPDVCTLGSNCGIINASTGDAQTGNGTSYATPVMTGAVACLWSALPDKTNMEIIELIKRHASQYDAPDDELGYGIPNLWNSYESTLPASLKTSDIPIIQKMHIFDLQGRYIGSDTNHLLHGVYIVREGSRVMKVIL